MNQQGGDGYAVDVKQPNIGNLPEISKINTDCSNAPNAEPVDFNNTLEVEVANNQLGGNNDPYKYIIDPITGSQILTRSIEGKNMLKNYDKESHIVIKIDKQHRLSSIKFN